MEAVIQYCVNEYYKHYQMSTVRWWNQISYHVSGNSCVTLIHTPRQAQSRRRNGLGTTRLHLSVSIFCLLHPLWQEYLIIAVGWSTLKRPLPTVANVSKALTNQLHTILSASELMLGALECLPYLSPLQHDRLGDIRRSTSAIFHVQQNSNGALLFQDAGSIAR